jgi:hypothetical protein
LRVGQQHFSNALSLSSDANRQSADQSGGHWIYTVNAALLKSPTPSIDTNGF